MIEPASRIEIRSGWIVDSISINGTNGCIVGESTGGNSNTINLIDGEQIVRVKADRVRFDGMICLARLYFETNIGRNYGPFGSAPSRNCPG